MYALIYDHGHACLCAAIALVRRVIVGILHVFRRLGAVWELRFPGSHVLLDVSRLFLQSLIELAC